MNSLIEAPVQIVNTSFYYDFFRLFSLVISGVFAGYTLQPVPKWLNNLFDTSILFKYMVLVIIGITALYPVNGKKMIDILISSGIILLLFAGLRHIDKLIEDKKKVKK